MSLHQLRADVSPVRQPMSSLSVPLEVEQRLAGRLQGVEVVGAEVKTQQRVWMQTHGPSGRICI